jgi:hypothetical protein
MKWLVDTNVLREVIKPLPCQAAFSGNSPRIASSSFA